MPRPITEPAAALSAIELTAVSPALDCKKAPTVYYKPEMVGMPGNPPVRWSIFRQELEAKMKLNRRELLAQTGLLAATAKWASAAAPGKAGSSILAKSDFPIAESQTYLNCAGWHPTPAASARAMKAYVDFKNTGKIDGRDTDSSTPV